MDTNKAVAGDMDTSAPPLQKEPKPVNETAEESTLKAEEQVEGTDDQT